MSGGYRRTWDKDFYEKKARDRLENGGLDSNTQGSSCSSVNHVQKEEFTAADETEVGPMGSQRAFLKARESKVDLDSKVGKTEIITQTEAVQARGAGFWCEVCTCLLKDSSAYLDHINGKKRE